MKIEGTGVFDDLWQAINDKSIRGIVLEGGSRSSKTWSICQALLLLGTQEPKDSRLQGGEERGLNQRYSTRLRRSLQVLKAGTRKRLTRVN